MALVAVALLVALIRVLELTELVLRMGGIQVAVAVTFQQAHQGHMTMVRLMVEQAAQ